MPSSIGSSGRPTEPIWKKWSMTQIESKPASSAVRTMAASVSPSRSPPPGHVKELIWRPSFMSRECNQRGVSGPRRSARRWWSR